MSTQPTLRVYAVEGKTVFALGDNGRILIPTRHVGRHPDGSPNDEGEEIAAFRTADDRLIAALPAYRSALESGDLTLQAPAKTESPKQ